VPLVAEDLGVLTDEVRALRDALGLPGMNVLEFSFHPHPSAEASRPHRYPKRSVVYTGTHDNDTLVGWLEAPPDDASAATLANYQKERAFALAYLDIPPSLPLAEMAQQFVRAALMNQADLAIIPAQDLLSLGRSARMNRPGIGEGNWAFRLLPEQLSSELAARVRGLGTLYGRATERKKPERSLEAEPSAVGKAPKGVPT
jgi:4-alpha-glucanotransferase